LKESSDIILKPKNARQSQNEINAKLNMSRILRMRQRQKRKKQSFKKSIPLVERNMFKCRAYQKIGQTYFHAECRPQPLFRHELLKN